MTVHFFSSSLLAGCSDSTIAIYDIQSSSGGPKQRYQQVCNVSHNRGTHKHSVETVQWYPMDTGLFTSSGADQQLKIWDTNRLKVCFFVCHAASFEVFLCVSLTLLRVTLLDLKVV